MRLSAIFLYISAQICFAWAGNLWDISEEGSGIRLLASFDIDLIAAYETKASKIDTKLFPNIPVVSYGGRCSQGGSATLELHMRPSGANHDWNLEITFVNGNRTGHTNHYYATEIKVEYFVEPPVFLDCIPRAMKLEANNIAELDSTFGSRFECVRGTQIGFSFGDRDSVLTLKNMKAELMLSLQTEFSERKSVCSGDSSADIEVIPLSVGLAILVCIIILLAILLGCNRRYERMHGSG
ncbi:unnamed protein product [Calicophoron daubneyi]|uniref:Lysosome-associated membrane glycoprotein 1 n=1 Tax=Calicophoron daubneyi TaxID=300641 RepID=A0AAV2T713_CALDB